MDMWAGDAGSWCTHSEQKGSNVPSNGVLVEWQGSNWERMVQMQSTHRTDGFEVHSP